jgi:Ca2+-binding RTX toxin-like protein
VIVGTDGDDVIRGRGGDDLICGGGGDDVLLGGPGADRIVGESGDDDLRGHLGDDVLDGGGGDDSLRGGRDDDVLLGGGGHDRIAGGPGGDAASGGPGDDRIAGNHGRDVLGGGDGRDRLRGGLGFDAVDGGRRRDSGAGGRGDDFCVHLEQSSMCEVVDPDLDRWLRSAPAVDLGTRLRDLLVLQTGCEHDRDLIAAAITAEALPTGARGALRRAVGALAASAQSCHVDAAAWASGLAEALEHLERLISLVTGEPTPNGDRPMEPGAVATAALDVSETIQGLLRAGPAGSWESDFWPDVVSQGHLRALTAAAGTGEDFDAVFVGTSTMTAGADPARFAGLTGMRAFNAGIPGSGPESQRVWLKDYLLDLVDPSLVVLGVEPREFRVVDGPGGSCAESTEAWDAAAALRDAAFAPVDALEVATTADLFFGNPPSSSPTRPTAAHTFYDGRYGPLGDLAAYPPHISDAEKEQLADIIRSWADGYSACDERIEIMGSIVEDLADLGVGVVVVAMPIADVAADAFTDGRATIDALLVRLEDVAAARGALGFVDASDAIPDARFHDLNHVDYQGSQLLTDLLVDAVEELL